MYTSEVATKNNNLADLNKCKGNFHKNQDQL